MPSSAGRRRLMPLVAVLMAVVVAGGLEVSGALRDAEYATIDDRFGLRDSAPRDDLVVVAIDDATIGELGVWPFSRRRHARVVRRLAAAGAELIVYDVQFTEPSPDPRADRALYDALGDAGGAILATSIADSKGRTNVLGGDRRLRAIRSVAASSALPDDSAGVIRRYEFTAGPLRTLATVAEQRLTGGRLTRADFDADGLAWIDFRGGPGSIPTLSFADVHSGRVDPALLRDRIVVVGASAPTLQDLHPTSTSPRTQMAGAEIQAYAIATALEGNPVRSAPGWLVWVLIAGVSCGVGLVHRRRGAITALLSTVVLGPLLAVGAYALFAWEGLLVPVVAPLLALVLAGFGSTVVGAVTEARERRRVARYSRELEAEVGRRTRALEIAQMEAVVRLARAAESRDETTGEHLERMSSLAHRLALAMGYSAAEAATLRHAALLHDVGKISLPDAILRKPGRLTAAERTVMQRHTLDGAALLSGSASPLLQMAERIARTHHERWDGGGYPAGLAGEAIPLEGRICAICDVFDALMSRRPYKEAWPLADALALIERESGGHFDPAVVSAFLPLVQGVRDEAPFVAGFARDGNDPEDPHRDGAAGAEAASAAGLTAGLQSAQIPAADHTSI